MSSAPAPTAAPSGFDRFRLHSTLSSNLTTAGFSEPRPVQAETIPAALEGQDVLGLAQTGTGKTAAFALPILQRLLEEPGDGPLVLILAPTRELSIQIDAEIRALAAGTPIRTTLVFGGVSQHRQVKALRGRPEIVVGCPGRVLDLLQQKLLDLSEVETLVLDEADHMFDMGFFRDVRKILAALPEDRQNLFFSATMPAEVRKLADELLWEPHVAELAHSKPVAQIAHAVYPVAEDRKRELLDHLLAQDDCGSAIVFTRTKHRAKRLAQQLDRKGHRAVALQGNMSQPQRDRAMQGFRERRFDVLVATDIAARGIDVAGIDYVINFDPPSTPETYTHRIGRTGRAEASGRACTFVTRDDGAWLRATERALGAAIDRHSVAGISDAKPAPNGRPEAAGPRNGNPNPRRKGTRPAGRRPRGRRRPRKSGAHA